LPGKAKLLFRISEVGLRNCLILLSFRYEERVRNLIRRAYYHAYKISPVGGNDKTV
jgi:hypothetical protein